MKKVVNGPDICDPSEIHEQIQQTAPQSPAKTQPLPEGRLLDASDRFSGKKEAADILSTKARLHKFFKKEKRNLSIRLSRHGPKLGGLWIA